LLSFMSVDALGDFNEHFSNFNLIYSFAWFAAVAFELHRVHGQRRERRPISSLLGAPFS